MLSLGPLAFTAPWLLLALVLLPILWLLLRAVPPAPVRRRFPGVALLLGLRDEETRADTTPWWLLLLRALAVAFVILGLAGPILNPEEPAAGDGPLLILADGTWADAPTWPARLGRIEAELARAGRVGAPRGAGARDRPACGGAGVPGRGRPAHGPAGARARAPRARSRGRGGVDRRARRGLRHALDLRRAGPGLARAALGGAGDARFGSGLRGRACRRGAGAAGGRGRGR